jgi:hypothetical protein
MPPTGHTRRQKGRLWFNALAIEISRRELADTSLTPSRRNWSGRGSNANRSGISSRLPSRVENEERLTLRSALQERQQELERRRQMADEKVSVLSCSRSASGLALTPVCPRAVQLKRQQANREAARAAQAAQRERQQAALEETRAARDAKLERKQALLDKARAALVARQRQAQPKPLRDPPPPRPRDPPPPRPKLPLAAVSAQTVVALPFLLRDPDGLYALLGLSPRDFRTVPSDDIIRDARINQLQLWHPDREGGEIERAQRINEAFERLATGAPPHPRRPPRSGAGPTDDSCASAFRRASNGLSDQRGDADLTRPPMTYASGASDRRLPVEPEPIRSARSCH